MKTLLTILLAICACTVAIAQEDFYRANEFSVDAFYEAHTSDFDKAPGAPGMGLNFFPHENIGIGVSTAMDNVEDTFIENVSGRLMYRVPVGRHAFYLWGGTTYKIKEETYSLILGPGVETRITKNFGGFLEIGIDKELSGTREASALVRAGIRISL